MGHKTYNKTAGRGLMVFFFIAFISIFLIAAETFADAGIPLQDSGQASDTGIHTTEATIIAGGKDWSLDTDGLLWLGSQRAMDSFTSNFTTFLKQINTIVMDDSITSVPASAFRYSTVETVVMSENITYIGTNAFANCENLEEISIPDGVRALYSGICRYCTGLKKVNFSPDSQLEYIGHVNFWGCTSLTELTIPRGVTEINENNFVDTALASITFLGEAAPQFDGGATSGISSMCAVNVPVLSVDDYTEALGSGLQNQIFGYVPSADIMCSEYSSGKYLVRYRIYYDYATDVKFNGEEMVYSEQYDSWVLITNEQRVPEASEFKVSTDMGPVLEYDGDINRNGKTNIVDAQLVYDMGRDLYTDISEPGAESWLKADVNGDRTVDALDARAIQVYVHTGTFAEN